MAQTAKLLIRDVVTAAAKDTVAAAAKTMKKNHIGCVIVTEGGRPAGIFTERDLLNKVVAEGLDTKTTPLSKVMTPNPVTIDSSEPLDKVFATLAQRRFRHVPITEAGRLVGIVSLSDLAGVLREVYREDRYLQYFVDYLEKGTAAKA